MNFSPKYDNKYNTYLENKKKELIQYVEQIKKIGHEHDFINAFFDLIGYTSEYDKEYLTDLKSIKSEVFYEFGDINVIYSGIKLYSKSFKIILSINNKTIEIKAPTADFRLVRKEVIPELLKLINEYGIGNNKEIKKEVKDIWDWVS